MRFSIQFFTDAQGHNPILEFLDGLNQKEAAKCLYYIDLLAEYGNRLPGNYIMHIEGDIWELRPEFGGTEFRLFYFFVLADTVFILHAVKKKARRLPRREIELAVKRAEEIRPNEQKSAKS